MINLLNQLLPSLSSSVSKTQLQSTSTEQYVGQIDDYLDQYLNLIMHHPAFIHLQSAWIGVMDVIRNNRETDQQAKILHLTKSELAKIASSDQNYKQSHLYHIIYHKEFNTPGGEPFSCLVGNYQFSHAESDIRLLELMSKVGQDALCPFISGASPHTFYHTGWHSAKKLENISFITQDSNHTAWRTFRKEPSAKFIVLTAPAYLGRYTYKPDSGRLNYQFTEHMQQLDDYCWVNAAFALARCMNRSYHRYGWCTSIRGYENGGLVSGMPLTDDLRAIECQLSDLHERELSKAGITALCQYKNTNQAVFFSCDTLHEPQVYEDDRATKNALISARLPFVMATSRFAHYLKIIARDKIGSFMETDDIEFWLNNWISQYVNSNAKSSPYLKAKFPLAEARIQVNESPTNAGAYSAIFHLRPWLQFEEIDIALRLVTELPKRQ